MEALAVQGATDFDCEAYGVLCDRLGRLLQRLGLERRAKPVNDGSTVLLDHFRRPPTTGGRP